MHHRENNRVISIMLSNERNPLAVMEKNTNNAQAASNVAIPRRATRRPILGGALTTRSIESASLAIPGPLPSRARQSSATHEQLETRHRHDHEPECDVLPRVLHAE